LKVFLLSIALVTISFLLQGDIGLNRSDEGFLWYGTIHSALGEVPLRDLQSYDPGRYYWGAAWFKILGNDSIVSLRISCAMFQVLGLTFALLSLRRITKEWWLLALEGVLLVLWLYPYYRVFELSISMAAVFFAIRLIERPSLLRHFIVGVFIGLSACVGRNLGLYTLLSFFLLIIFIWGKLDRNAFFTRFALWACGILVGYSPILLMFIGVHGFFESYLGIVAFLSRIGGTNLTLPIPWPWRPQTGVRLSERVFFLLFPLFSFTVLPYLLLLKSQSLRGKYLLIASAFVSLTSMHYTFSRADLEHLSGGISPLLIGLMSVPSAFQFNSRKILNTCWFVGLLAATCLSVGRENPYFLKIKAPELYVKKLIGGNLIWIDRDTAGLLGELTRINALVANEGLLIAPHWTTFYPILERKSPLGEIYFIFPQTEQRQKEMIEELHQKKIDWVILHDNDAIDGRDDLRFRNTHPLLWHHFVDVFEVIEHKGSPYNYQLLHRKLKS